MNALILVVDDDRVVATMLAQALAADGHEVEVAPDGLAALDRLARRRFDVIVTDVRMPRLDGPGLYRELERRHPELVGRVVFITGDTLGSDTGPFLTSVAAPTLRKPFAITELSRTVRRILAR